MPAQTAMESYNPSKDRDNAISASEYIPCAK